MGRKNKFAQHWGSQTDIGKKFGLSGIAVGKVLIEHGLKDQQSKEATQEALDGGFAKSTPLSDGTPFFMWSREKVGDLLRRSHHPLSYVDRWVHDVRRGIARAKRLEKQEGCTAAEWYLDHLVDEIPEKIRDEVLRRVESSSGSEKAERQASAVR